VDWMTAMFSLLDCPERVTSNRYKHVLIYFAFNFLINFNYLFHYKIKVIKN
jgi:hypothetical protein